MPGAILANDFEPGVGHARRHRVERLDQPVDAAPLKSEPTNSTIGIDGDPPSGRVGEHGASGRMIDAERNYVTRDRSMPMWRAISGFENSVSVITVRARRADHAVSSRRRRPSRNENHSGWAKNDTS